MLRHFPSVGCWNHDVLRKSAVEVESEVARGHGSFRTAFGPDANVRVTDDALTDSCRIDAWTGLRDSSGNIGALDSRELQSRIIGLPRIPVRARVDIGVVQTCSFDRDEDLKRTRRGDF